jgi:hypothetical protein
LKQQQSSTLEMLCVLEKSEWNTSSFTAITTKGANLTR